MQIKVCGITRLDQLEQLDAMGVQMAGLIFYPKSPRYVMNFELNNEAVQDLELKLKKVGVFVNASEEEIFKPIKDFDLDLVQLHGNESPEFCAEISAWIPVIKAFRLSEGVDLEAYQHSVDYFLFDSGSSSAKEFGGTGHPFDWSLLNEQPVKKPFFLSGGIGPDDAKAIQNLTAELPNNKLWAVDLNSRFEIEPGLKDLKKVQQFINDLKS